MVVKGSFVPGMPVAVMMAIILVTGVIRSVFFTAQNALAFADIDDADAAPATAIHAVMRPIGTALGVALAAGVLEASAAWRNSGIDLFDFRLSFYIVALVSLASALPFIFMSRTAGNFISGHRSRAEREAALAEAREAGRDANTPRY
jgi:hypothetical protein